MSEAEDALKALGVEAWVGIALYRVERPDTADLSWYNGRLRLVVKRTVGSVVAKIDFGDGDSDNNIEWVLKESSFVENNEAIQNNWMQKPCHPMAWRVYTQEPAKQILIKALSKDDLIAIIGGMKRRAGYVPLETLSYQDLICIVDGRGIPHHCFLDKDKKQQKRKTDAAEAADDSAPKKTRDTSDADAGGFAAYKKEMNARLKQIEDQVKSLTQSQSALKHELGKLKKEKHVAVSDSVAARKDNMFAKIALKNGVEEDKPVYNDLWPGVRDGTIKTFGVPLNYPRCVRYLHTSQTTTACLSAHKGEKEHLFNKRPMAVPFAIMESDPKLSKLVGYAASPATEGARVPSVTNAHERWYMYVTCDACVNGVTELKFLTWKGKGGVWKHCAVCSNGNGVHKAGGVVPVCEECHTDIAKDGNDQNGDDRSRAMKALEFRFPWLLFEWNDGLRWRDMFKRSAALANSIRGPDTVFAVELQEVGKRVWIVLEEDGNGHADAKYPEEEEFNRMLGIQQSLIDKGRGDHVFIIRYTPKERFKTSTDFEAEPDKTVRLLVVRAWVCWFIVQLLKKKDCAATTVLYLFYDFANRHFQRAKRSPAEDWRVGWACTFPQDIVTDDDAYDWRYALNPNEGVLFNVVGGRDGLFKVAAAEAFE